MSFSAWCVNGNSYFFEKRYASTEMVNPNFVAIAEGYYIQARKVVKREDLKEAVAEMMASKEA